MSNIAEIDSNFKFVNKIQKEGIKFYDVLKKPFKIYGVKHFDGKFRRMPEEIARTVSEGVGELSSHTAGGRVRFVTDSPYIAVVVKLGSVAKGPHFSFTGIAGLDLYVREDGKENYKGTFVPPDDAKGDFESIIEFKEDTYGEPVGEMREITINFPCYSEVIDLYIGLDENAVIKEASDYINEKPVVYYGHSITQGGCCSRPGFAYPNIISRRFHSDFVNLGFSGSALGETEIAEYIASLDMEAFVYDYDHNAGTPEHLRNTHEKMFQIIREKHPDIPVIFITTTPKNHYLGDKEERKQILLNTFENAKNKGDENVYFLDAIEIYEGCVDGLLGATVEGCHLNDLGFTILAKAVGDILEKSLNKK